MIYLLALLIGVVAGLRALLAPTAVSWAASRVGLDVGGHWFAFFGFRWMPWIFTVAALGELVNDKLPATPSRLIPPQFGVRIVAGGLSGAVLAGASANWIIGLVMGVVGAIIGTLGGAKMRATLATGLGSDFLAAVFEDAFAILAALGIVVMAS